MFHAACVPGQYNPAISYIGFKLITRAVAHTSILRGDQVGIVMRRFELEPFLANVEKFEITDMLVVPPIAIGIIMSGLGKKYSLKSVKAILCGAAPLGKESQEKLRQLLAPGATVLQVWGMTETSCIASMFHYPEDDDTGSVGRMLPNIDAKYAFLHGINGIY
jgi:long-subunit acyl-CoA synthetase (AMP-forming)